MGIFVGAGQSTFLNFGSLTGVGIGTTTTSGRNAGVNTAVGTLIYNVDDVQIQVYDGNNWIGGLTSPLRATGGTKDTTSRSGFAVHTFTGDGTLVVEAGDTSTAEYIVVAGGGNGGCCDMKRRASCIRFSFEVALSTTGTMPNSR